MKFILSKELGRLCKWLRILGFDAVYFKGDNRGILLVEALRDGRIILTRNSKLSRKIGTKIIQIKSDKLRNQINQLIKELKLSPDKNLMFSRCIVCNSELEEVDKNRIKPKVPEYVFNNHQDFLTCPICGRVYWKGTHWGNVQSVLNQIRQ